MGQRKTPACWPGASGAPSERIPIDTNTQGSAALYPGLSYNAASRLKPGYQGQNPWLARSVEISRSRSDGIRPSWAPQLGGGS